ncbi:MAG: TonB family protein [Nitrospira sp.]|nr:TonB family protein [Nitrospira sp.]
MTTLSITHPLYERHRWHGWICSVAFHSLMAASAAALLSEIQLPLPEESFAWNVAMVEPPPQPQAAPRPELQPQQPPRKPAIAESRPRPPQPAVEPVQRQAVQEMRPAQQMVQRQVAHIVQTTSPVTTVNQTATVVTQAVQQYDVPSQSIAPVATQSHAVQEASAIATAAQAVTEAAVTRPLAETSVERPAIQAVAEPAAQQTQQIVTRQAAEPVSDRASADSHETPPAIPQEHLVAQLTPTKAVPTTKADYGWLMRALMGRVEQLKNYPHLARLNRWEGKVVLRAVIRDDGQVLAIDVQESSGRSILDDAAIETLRNASPLKLEHPLGKPQVAILMPISYSLRR